MKKILSMLLALVLILSLTACGPAQPELLETAKETAALPEVLPDRVSYNHQQDGQSLIIDAPVSFRENIPNEVITLVQDPDAKDRIFKDLVQDPADIDRTDDQGRLVGITFDTENTWGGPGYLQFEDHGMTDWEEQSLDGEHFFDSGYITPLKPGGFQKSAQEVLEELAEDLEGYSCLDYHPIRAEAREGKTGAYYWSMDASFEGLPIVSRDFHPVGGQIRETGLESVQGLLLLKVGQRSPMEDPLTFDQALECLKEDFFLNSYAKEVRIDEISFCYMAAPTKEGWILSPAWVFQGTQSKENISPYEEMQNGDESRIAFFYELRDGFLDVFKYSNGMITF